METNNCSICDVKWKTDISSVKIAIIPANSRPLLQPRVWHVKNRPMPELLTNENNNTLEIIDNKYSLIKSTTVNNEDYLEYNNPAVKLNSDGAIVCDNEDGVFHNNMYSGPGWKKSKIHPNTRTALSRPIKHWRKQLFPRQVNYEATTTSRGRRNSGGLFDKPNGYFITDKIVSKEISCLPIYVNTTKDILNSCVKLDILNYGKITNCSIKTALFKSRPGSYTSNSIYQFNSNKSYLQARSKLYEQLAIVNSSTTTNSSFYLNYNRNININIGNCKTVPSFVVNNNHYPLSSKTNSRRKSKNAIKQNQYNITNKYGITAPNIKVPPPPTANLTATAYTITAGESVTLIPTFTNLFDGMALLNDQRISLGISYIISPTSTTTYTLNVINSAGYSVISSVTIIVIPRPTSFLSITSGSSSITSGQGQQVILRSLFTNGTATINDASQFNGVTVANNETYTITPTSTTTYTLRVTNSIGFSVTSIITITVVPMPTATLSITAGSFSITSGQEVTLTSFFTNGTATINKASPFNGVAITNNGTYIVSPTVTTTYTLRVTNSIGYYVDSNIITITVYPVPTGTLNLTSGSSTIIIGDSVTIIPIFANGTATINGLSIFDGFAVTNNGTYIVSPTVTTTYTLSVTNDAGFSVTSIITITVVPMPTATLSITAGSSSITSGQGQEVTLRSLFTNGTATIYDNSSFNYLAVTNNGTYIVRPSVTTSYTLTVTNSLGYYIDSSVTITVYPVPTGTLNLTSSVSTITQSQSVTMSGTFADGTADIISVSTSDNSTIISTIHSNINLSQSYSITPDVTSDYRLRVTNGAGYFILSSNTININVYQTGSLVANRIIINRGPGFNENSTLTATVVNGTGILRIYNSSTNIQTNITSTYSTSVSPFSTTTYELYVTYNSISSSYRVTIYVVLNT